MILPRPQQTIQIRTFEAGRRKSLRFADDGPQNYRFLHAQLSLELHAKNKLTGWEQYDDIDVPLHNNPSSC